MGLPSAPKVEIRLPETVFVGHQTPVIIDVVAKAETKIDFIDVRVRGIQYWIVGSGKSAVSLRQIYPELVLRLVGPGTLPAGPSQYRTSFVLPPGAAPSHDHQFVEAKYDLRVHVSIPWWPDGRYAFVVPVRLPPPAAVVRQPVLLSTAQMPNKPRIEASLASNVLVAGEVLNGSFALFHVDDGKPRKVEISLVPSFQLFGRGRMRDRAAASRSYEVEMPVGGAGAMQPFQLRLPADMTPTFETVTHKLSWYLVVKYGTFFGGHLALQVPILVLDGSAIAIAPKLALPPRLADQRIVQIFAAVAAENRFRVATTADGSPAVEVEIGEATMTIAYDYRGQAGAALVARVAHPSLGLDLSIVPGSRVRHLFIKDIEVDIASWDRDHYVTARAADQTAAFLKRVVPAMMRVDGGAFVEWTDESIVYSRDVANVEGHDIVALANSVDPVVRAILAALPAIDPPIPTDLDAWRELARTLHGTLTIGELAIDGEVDGQHVGLDLVWDAKKLAPIGMRAHAGDAQHASELVKQVAVALASPAIDAAAAKLPDGVADALAAWPLDTALLEVKNGVVSAQIPVVDPARATDLVRRVRALRDLIDPGAGPYR